jgi:hypothetical protein
VELTEVVEFEKGDYEGHPFRGNQYVKVPSRGGRDQLDDGNMLTQWAATAKKAAKKAAAKKLKVYGPSHKTGMPLSLGQYRALLQETQWGGSEGKALDYAIHSWQGSPTAIRKAIEAVTGYKPVVRQFRYDQVDLAPALAMLERIKVSAPTTQPLYRGKAKLKIGDVTDLDTLREKANLFPGAVIDVPAWGFTTSKSMARSYAGNNPHSIIFRLAPGAKAFKFNQHWKDVGQSPAFVSEHEWATGGRYEVTAITPRHDSNSEFSGAWVVDIRQVGVIDPFKGVTQSSAVEAQASRLASRPLLSSGIRAPAWSQAEKGVARNPELVADNRWQQCSSDIPNLLPVQGMRWQLKVPKTYELGTKMWIQKPDLKPGVDLPASTLTYPGTDFVIHPTELDTLGHPYDFDPPEGYKWARTEWASLDDYRAMPQDWVLVPTNLSTGPGRTVQTTSPEFVALPTSSKPYISHSKWLAQKIPERLADPDTVMGAALAASTETPEAPEKPLAQELGIEWNGKTYSPPKSIAEFANQFSEVHKDFVSSYYQEGYGSTLSQPVAGSWITWGDGSTVEGEFVHPVAVVAGNPLPIAPPGFAWSVMAGDAHRAMAYNYGLKIATENPVPIDQPDQPDHPQLLPGPADKVPKWITESGAWQWVADDVDYPDEIGWLHTIEDEDKAAITLGWADWSEVFTPNAPLDGSGNVSPNEIADAYTAMTNLSEDSPGGWIKQDAVAQLVTPKGWAWRHIGTGLVARQWFLDYDPDGPVAEKPDPSGPSAAKPHELPHYLTLTGQLTQSGWKVGGAKAKAAATFGYSSWDTASDAWSVDPNYLYDNWGMTLAAAWNAYNELHASWTTAGPDLTKVATPKGWRWRYLGSGIVQNQWYLERIPATKALLPPALVASEHFTETGGWSSDSVEAQAAITMGYALNEYDKAVFQGPLNVAHKLKMAYKSLVHEMIVTSTSEKVAGFHPKTPPPEGWKWRHVSTGLNSWHWYLEKELETDLDATLAPGGSA